MVRVVEIAREWLKLAISLYICIYIHSLDKEYSYMNIFVYDLGSIPSLD